MADEVSRRTKEELPARVLKLLGGLGVGLGPRATMAVAGYTEEEHTRGWTLLHKVSGYEPDKANPMATDVRVRDAIAELDAWDEQGFRRIKAALNHHHPEQAKFVFEGLQPASGAESVLAVDLLLERLGTLEQGRSEQTRQADKAAIATLTARGIDDKERARLAELTKIAKSVTMTVPAQTTSDAEATREVALDQLYAWYTDWSETARAVIRRRDYLIRLGLARRRKSKDAPTEEPTST